MVHLGQLFAADSATSSAEQTEPNQLSIEEENSIRNFCDEYKDIFHLKGDKLAYTRNINYRIPLIQNQEVINQKRYRLPQIYRRPHNSSWDFNALSPSRGLSNIVPSTHSGTKGMQCRHGTAAARNQQVFCQINHKACCMYRRVGTPKFKMTLRHTITIHQKLKRKPTKILWSRNSHSVSSTPNAKFFPNYE